MSGWITFPLKNTSKQDRNRPFLFQPMLHHKWMFMAQDIKRNPELAGKKNPDQSSTIGFYCGFMHGQAPSLTDGLPNNPMLPYEAHYLITQKVLEPSLNLSAISDNSLGDCLIIKFDPVLSVTIRGSLPSAPPFLMVRECKYFRFSPYRLKQQ